jgi:pyrroloquinoline quinone (PQQ) biosynthesis protein C
MQTLSRSDRQHPRLRENVWHIDPTAPNALLITASGRYEVPSADATTFLKMRSYCTGHHSLEEIAAKSGLSVKQVTTTIEALAEIELLCSSEAASATISIERVRTMLTHACAIWGAELVQSYIGNEFVSGELPKEVLVGWLVEMYHYIHDFPHALDRAVAGATGRLKDVLSRYADEERNHDVFVLHALENIGVGRRAVETSTPLLSTRMIGFLMRELFELEPTSALMVAAMLEAPEFDEPELDAVAATLGRHYGVEATAFDPYFKHQKIDVSLGHAELLAKNLDLVQVTDVRTLDQITNKLHDLKHCFELQGLEIRHYYSELNGKYLPRQPVRFSSL